MVPPLYFLRNNFPKCPSFRYFRKKNLGKRKIFAPKHLTICFWLMVACPSILAQVKTGKDTLDIYEKIEQFSQKSDFTEKLHQLLFRPTKNKPRNTQEQRHRPKYKPFAGKVIRRIIIDTKDPFGFSFSDSTETANSWLERTGNAIHIKSKQIAIRNFLLLKEGQRLDTLLLLESARLLRAQNYIREVRFSPQWVGSTRDSIDITITALDSWSLIPQVELSATQTKLRLRERNIIGTGHQLDLGFNKRLEDGRMAYRASYRVPNFMNTFISAWGTYETDYAEHFSKSMAVDRQFFSPLTKWAGGVYLEERSLGVALPNDSSFFSFQNLRFQTQDYWAGHSLRIFKGNTERERTTNLIFSLRALLVDYSKTAAPTYDTIGYFTDETLFLGSVGMASRQFIEDEYIFRDGITEDVPVGVVYAITGGVQRKNGNHRTYFGARAAYGNYTKWGYLSFNLEAGSYFKGSRNEQTTYALTGNYFSNLWSLGPKWKMRQFIKPQLAIGTHRLPIYADRVSLNENPIFNGVYGNPYGGRNGMIPGFNGQDVGTKKYALGLQTQFYSPWEFLGFRLNPFINITGGVLAQEFRSNKSNGFYSSFGLGVMIRNDYLVFKSFQLSFIFYPNIPGEGSNILKTNAFENDDFGLPNFQIGKPRTVLYN